jgi:hypothetical protein
VRSSFGVLGREAAGLHWVLKYFPLYGDGIFAVVQR